MNPHTGSDFDTFLEEEGLLEEVSARAHKRLLTIQLSEAIKTANVSRSELAARLHTSPTQLDHLLDPEDTEINLQSLERLALAVRRRLRIELA